jgi:hypothetical protein
MTKSRTPATRKTRSDGQISVGGRWNKRSIKQSITKSIDNAVSDCAEEERGLDVEERGEERFQVEEERVRAPKSKARKSFVQRRGKFGNFLLL